MALGGSRGHACACADGPALLPTTMCPACLLRAQANFVRETFPELSDEAPLSPDQSGRFPTKSGMIGAITALAEQLGKSIKTHSGAPSWDGHAMRRGGAQYLAAAGVDIWRIQALARHSSAAVLLYIEKAHVPTLKSISIEAASGRQQHALTIEVARLKELLCERLRARPRQETTISQSTSPDNIKVKWICMQKQNGKAHTKSRTSPGTAMCKWPWAQAAKVIHCKDPFGPQDDYRLKCVKCTDGDSDDSSVNSTDEDAPKQAVQ